MLANKLAKFVRDSSKDDGDNLPPSGKRYVLENEKEEELRRQLCRMVIRLYCAGRLRSQDFKKGESRAKPYAGYNSDNDKERLMKDIDGFLADHLFNGDLVALRNFTESSTGPNGSSKYIICGKQFKPQDVVYSCRTCALDNTCVLCTQCFTQSIHTGHDYRMHASGGGGYCDCGDVEAWRDGPACRTHTVESENDDKNGKEGIKQNSLPDSLKENADAFFRYVMRFIEQIYTADYKELPADLHENFALEFPTALTSWMTVLLNDEIHSFDEVIRTLRYGVSCTNSQADVFANEVDKNGRTIIYYGPVDDCTNAMNRVSHRSAQENHKQIALGCKATSFALFQLQELAGMLL